MALQFACGAEDTIMNFAEICGQVLEESDGRVETFSSVNLGTDGSGDLYVTDPTQRNVIRWVNQAYMKIQQQQSYWKFMHKRGIFLTAVADQEEYPKKSVREIKDDSVYAIKSGTTGRVPLVVWDYDYWLAQERSGATASGGLRWLLRAPDEKWILYPVPNATWTIYADWWLRPCEMEAVDDEPVWDSEFHELLVWMAVRKFAAEFEGEGSTPRLLSRVDDELPAMMNAFRRRYLPTPKGASPQQ